MKKIKKMTWCLLILVALLMVPLSVSAKTDKGINIKKTFVKGICVELSQEKYDKNQDGYLSKKEINNIKKLYLYSYLNDSINSSLNLKGISKLKNLEKVYFDADRYIYNIKEIEKLHNLKKVQISVKLKRKKVLDFRKNKKIDTLILKMPSKKGVIRINENNRIKYLKLSGIRNSISVANKCKKVKKVYLYGTTEKKPLNITNRKKLENLVISNIKTNKTLDIIKCPKLKKLELGCNKLKRCTISDTSITEEVYFYDNHINECNIENVTGIFTISLIDSKIDDLKIINLDEVKLLKIAGVELSNIHLANLKSLKKIDMHDIKKLSTFKISNLNALCKITIVRAKKLKNLTIENVANLKELHCGAGILSELNILGMNKIKKINVSHNKLKKFEYSNLKDLVELNINNNEVEGKFDFTLYPHMYILDCDNNKLTEIYGGVANRQIDWISCVNNQIKLIDFRGTTDGCIMAMN